MVTARLRGRGESGLRDGCVEVLVMFWFHTHDHAACPRRPSVGVARDIVMATHPWFPWLCG